MSREEARKLLITFGIEEPTDEQITNYLNSVNGEVQKEKTKLQTDKAELERLKKVEEELEAEKNKNLTAEQKLQAELEKAQLMQKDFAKKTNQLEVEKILVGAGLTKEDYAEYIDLLVSENAETSLKLANGLIGTLTKQKEATEKKVKADLLNGTPLPDGGRGTGDTKTEAEKFVEGLVETKVNADKASQEALNYYTGGNK
jgi:argininosuccinate lyase